MKNSRINMLPWGARCFINVFCFIYMLACVLPLIIIISVSLSDETAIIEKGYGLLPRNFTTYAYEFVLREGNVIFNAYFVTILATVAGTVLSLMVISMFAYPLSRKSLKYRSFFSMFVFITMLFSGGLVPWYIVCSRLLHITNTYLALILPYVMNVWYVIIMRTFFVTTIPDSLIESAKIDGASELKTFLKIVMPLSKPGLATVGLFITITYWNDWWLPLILTTDQKYANLQFTLFRMLTNGELLIRMSQFTNVNTSKFINLIPSESSRMAMCILAIGPIVLAYPFFQKYFIKGLTIGAIKG